VIKQLEGKGFHGLLLSVQSTILDAFYTSETVIKGVYDGLKTLGFTGGEILEPSAGIGNFIGFMPKEMRENSVITQVEIDPISAHINQQLYQDTEVFNRPFQGAKIPYRNYDLVVSNIPFGYKGI
jgi:phospholipid N-methyltransferase